jgi:hypothetical protein
LAHFIGFVLPPSPSTGRGGAASGPRSLMILSMPPAHRRVVASVQPQEKSWSTVRHILTVWQVASKEYVEIRVSRWVCRDGCAWMGVSRSVLRGECLNPQFSTAEELSVGVVAGDVEEVWARMRVSIGRSKEKRSAAALYISVLREADF